MNIIEAVKSGKRFKRKKQSPDYWCDIHTPSNSFTKEELLADDWEVEEERLTITKEQFWRVAQRIVIGEHVDAVWQRLKDQVK